jgi:beta-lactamase class D
VRRLAYGNRDVSGRVDSFWLDGQLRISARQQVEFLRRLHERELPVSDENATRVERLILLDEHDGVVLRGKTGLTVQDDRAVGWLVGFVERGFDRYVYALLVVAPRARMSDVMAARKPLATRLLVRAGALPQAWLGELR